MRPLGLLGAVARAFEARVRAADTETRDAVKAILVRLIDDDDPGLSVSQRESLKLSVAAVDVV